MKPTFGLRELQRQKIFELLEILEDDLIFENISVKEARNWKYENEELAEDKLIRYEYNFLAKRFILKCNPTATHHSLQSFFLQTVYGFLAENVGSSNSHKLATVGCRTCM